MNPPPSESASARPLFSVIIPVYNRAGLIAETLRSVLAQDFDDFELIVVDDGSTDGSAEAARAVDPRVQVLTVPNGGPGPARNHGIRAARGRYLAFLDSDDLWFPWTLTTYAGLLREHDWPSILLGRPHVFSEGEALPTIPEDEAVRTFEHYLAYPDEKIWWGVSSFVLARELTLAAGGFVEAGFHAEDAELLLRLGTAPGLVWVQSPATFAYRRHEGSIMRQTQKNLDGLDYLLRQERAGKFPGGPALARARRTIITAYTRSASIGMARQGLKGAGWALYRRTFGWHLRLGRWKYLCAFPLLLLR